MQSVDGYAFGDLSMVSLCIHSVCFKLWLCVRGFYLLSTNGATMIAFLSIVDEQTYMPVSEIHLTMHQHCFLHNDYRTYLHTVLHLYNVLHCGSKYTRWICTYIPLANSSLLYFLAAFSMQLFFKELHFFAVNSWASFRTFSCGGYTCNILHRWPGAHMLCLG